MPDFTHDTGEMAVRFHRDDEWYVRESRQGLEILRVHATGERAVELFHRLAAYLDPVVDVTVEDPRDGTGWEGALRFLPDVREAVGRLRWPLASHGGVEVTLVTPDDQLSLMPSLEIVICSRGADWGPRVEAEGVSARESPPPAVWDPGAVSIARAPELTEALEMFALRLELTGASPA